MRRSIRKFSRNFRTGVEASKQKCKGLVQRVSERTSPEGLFKAIIGGGFLLYSTGYGDVARASEGFLDDLIVSESRVEKTDGGVEFGDDRDEFGNRLPKNNPGRFDMVGRESKEVLAFDISDGLRVSTQMQLGMPTAEKAFITNHIFWLGTQNAGTDKGSYEFQTILQSGKFVMIGGIDTLKRLTGRVVSMLAKGTMLKSQFQIVPNDEKVPDSIIVKLEQAGSDWSAAAESSNILESLSLSYLQKLTKSVSLGAQYTVFPLYGIAPLTCVGRYKQNGHTMCANVSWMQNQMNVQLAYARKVDKHFSLATETVLTAQKSHSAVGLKYDFLNDSKSRYFASFDSDMNTSVHYSEEVVPMCRIGVCGQIQHAKNDYVFGMQFSMGEG
eukprot:CAMPEP_0197529208 /NCGR_PEP_ID=MMETSP1318-20131121/27618_1 /TAXON_ID=552666 /ORGANISM="Partenskyella glossopodia, Strain RCC365" /LENGTH=384 /DNA_ID=CAMNT_0043084589 /DNA_START=56 /DNA_END=1210 /DNA_ORIENTATION=-